MFYSRYPSVHNAFADNHLKHKLSLQISVEHGQAAPIKRVKSALPFVLCIMAFAAFTWAATDYYRAMTRPAKAAPITHKHL